MKLLWKEWRQQRGLFLGGCLAGISFPFLECLLNWRAGRQFHTDMGSAIVMVAGPFFALILAVAATQHDVKKGLDNFWPSRPIPVWRLFAAKFFVGAAVLLVSFLFVMSLDLATAFLHYHQLEQTAWAGFCYTYPIALFLFAATIFILVLLRDAAKTVLLAIWLGLLIYCLPLLLGSLDWMNIFVQMNDASYSSSLLKYLFWKLSLPDLSVGQTTIKRPADIPFSYYFIDWLKEIWLIISSPDYLQYLRFLGMFLAGSIVGVVLAVTAFKRNWRWQPGQKTIAWTLGLSGAFIFGVAMTQVGHNLPPVQEWQNKKLVSPAVFDWSYMPASFREGIPEGQWIAANYMAFGKSSDAVCLQNDLMFRVSCGFQWGEKKRIPKWDDEVIRHFVLQIYRFPYKENNKADSGPGNLPNFAVGAMRLFTTEPLPRHDNQQAFGCFTKDNYLYIAYRPTIRENPQHRLDVKNMPIYFATVDITNPENPALIDNLEITPTENFCRGFVHYGDYCYISDGGQLVIISVAQPDHPQIVRQIRYSSPAATCGGINNEKDNYTFDLGNNPAFPSFHFTVVGNRLLFCSNYTNVALLDPAQPTSPEIIFNESLTGPQPSENDKIRAVAAQDDHIFISTNNGLFSYQLTKQPAGRFTSRLVGKRLATPIEKLAGRRPSQLLFYQGCLVEAAGPFGVLVYDISDPAHPRRIYHAETPSAANDIGIWNGLLYMETIGFKVYFFNLPGMNQ